MAWRRASPVTPALMQAQGAWLQGYESHVLEGGQNVLLHRKIPYIHTEVGPTMMLAAGGSAAAFLQQFVEVRPLVMASTMSHSRPVCPSRMWLGIFLMLLGLYPACLIAEEIHVCFWTRWTKHVLFWTR